jgi:hypothetical protein
VETQDPVTGGQCMAGSLSGADAFERVSRVYKGGYPTDITVDEV